jgi:hypothetical protein
VNSTAPKRLPYATAIAECLDPGEQVRWVGQPRQGIFLRAADLGLIPFSLFWGGFAITWETIAVRSILFGSGAPTFIKFLFPLWGIPFVIIGLYIMIGRFFVDSWIRRRVWYAITDRRVLIVTLGISRQLSSFDLRTLSEVNFQQHSDGTGSIIFGPTLNVSRNGRGVPFPGTRRNQFDHTTDAAEAYRILREVQQASS